MPQKKLLAAAAMAAVLILSSLEATLAATEEGVPEIQWKENGILVNDTPGKSNHKNPRIAAVGRGEYIVVWEDERNGFPDIYAQKIDESGRKLWGEDGVPVCNAPKNQSSPQITVDDLGGAIVAWEDYRSGTADIYAQKINPDGSIAWGIGGLPICLAKAAQLAPKICSDGAGGAIITWYDYRSGLGEDIYAQRVDKDGKVVWDTDGIPISTASGTQWYPEIMADGSGGAIMVWTDFRSGKGSDIYGQHVDKDGKMLWQQDGLPICFADDNQAYPKLASSGTGDAIVVWDDFRNGNFDVYSQKITSAGVPVWTLNGVRVTPTDSDDERPEIAPTPDDGAVVCWLTRRGDHTEVIAQRLTAAGEPKWNKNGITVCKSVSEKDHINMITGSDGGALVVWEDTRNGAKNIYAQKLADSGFPLWGEDGTLIAGGMDGSELPDLAAGTDDSTIIVWQDFREGNADIYGQNVDGSGGSEWKDNGISINNSTGSVTQQNPSLCYDPDETCHIAVWEDGRNGYFDIFAQKINEAGDLLFSKDGAPVCDAPGTQRSPAIVYSGNGSAIVAWEDNRTGKTWDIYSQKINKDGSRVWVGESNSTLNGVIASRSGFAKSKLKMISDGQNGAIMVWQEDRVASRLDIYAQRISESGKPLWGAEGVAVCTAQSDQTEPVITTDGAGGAIIAWTDYRSGAFNSDIYAQRITADGTIVWKDNGVPVCTAADSQRSPDICDNGAGGAIICWTDKGGGGYDIYGQIIDNYGKPLLTVDGIPICQAPGTQRDPRIVSDSQGGGIVVWNDFRNLNWDIFAQRIDKGGTMLWGENGKPICTAPLTQYAPEIVSGGFGSIITWEDYRNGSTYNIYAQKIDNEGNPLWQLDGIAVCLSPDGERGPKIAPNGGGGAVIAWEDFRGGGFGIYAQKIKVIKLK